MIQAGDVRERPLGEPHGRCRCSLQRVYDPDLAPAVSWTPALRTGIDPTHRVTGLVMSGSGPFNW